MRLKTLAGAAAAAAGGAFLYRKFLREPILTWGATAEEAAARLPGDELLESADGIATRAITIDAAFGGVAVDRPDGAVATRTVPRVGPLRRICALRD